MLLEQSEPWNNGARAEQTISKNLPTPAQQFLWFFSNSKVSLKKLVPYLWNRYFEWKFSITFIIKSDIKIVYFKIFFKVTSFTTNWPTIKSENLICNEEILSNFYRYVLEKLNRIDPYTIRYSINFTSIRYDSTLLNQSI